MRSLWPMTSAEFVAKYKLFKPIAERGARSFLAQEVEGRRAVLVHRLDIAPPDENRRLLGSLETLRPEERTSVIEVMDVDGVAVVVTRFTPDFHDLPSWLAEREQPAPARAEAQPLAVPSPSGFTSAFSEFGLADAPPPLGSSARSTPVPGSALGAVRPPVAPPPPIAPPPAAAPAPGGEFTQLFGAPLGRTPEPSTPAPPAPATPAPGEFTQLFKGFGATSPVSEPFPTEPPYQAGAPTPPPVPPPRSDSSWPPAPAVPTPAARSVPQPPPFAAPPSAPPPPSAPARGEFTQLFQGLTAADSPPSGGSHPPLPPPPPAFGAPAAPYTSPPPGALPPLTPPGAGTAPPVMGPPGPPVFADAPPIASPAPPFMGSGGLPAPPPLAASFGTSAAPPYGSSFGGPPPLGGFVSAPPGPPLGPPSAPPPTLGSGSMFSAPPSAPPSFPPPGASASPPPGIVLPAENSVGASEFTRMLGAIAPPRTPPPPPLPVAPPAPVPAPAGQQAGGGSIKAYLPLILGLNVVLIAAATAILYFLLKS
jgi:hypothetical protein